MNKKPSRDKAAGEGDKGGDYRESNADEEISRGKIDT
jgi:hypothetical protein